GTSYQTKPAGNADTFFSKLLQTIDEKMPNAASASDVRALLRSQGVKADEIRWSGIEHLLSGKEKLTKEEVRSWVEANTIQVFDVTPKPKFENTSYVLPGQKKNYVELLLALSEEAFEGPATKALSAFQVQMARKYTGDRYGSGWAANLTPEEQATYKDLQQKFGGGLVSTLPKIGHYSETPGVIVHVRFAERRTASGGRMLFIEEIQSDWHQQGRNKGYLLSALPEGYELKKKSDAGWSVVGPDGKIVSAAGTRPAALRGALSTLNVDRVPDAPFKSSWPELALKRMLRYAAENGYDSLGWTTGAQQADRYNLAKYVDEVHFTKSNDGTEYFLTGKKDGYTVMHQTAVKNEKLTEHVGKEIASKIIDSGGKKGILTGLDLQVGGQGMNYFYDKMIPSFVEKYGKKWGVKVETEQLGRNKTYHPYSLGSNGLLTPLTERGFDSEEEARSAMDRKLSAAGKKNLRVIADTGSGYQVHWSDEDMGGPGMGTLAHESTFSTFEAAQKQAVNIAKDVARGTDEKWQDFFQDLIIKPADGPGKPTGYKIVGDVADFWDEEGTNNFPTPQEARSATIEYLRDPWYEDPDMFDRPRTIVSDQARDRYIQSKGRETDPELEAALAAHVDSSYRFEPITDQQIVGYRVMDEAGEDIEPMPGHQHPPEIRTEADAKALAQDYAAETLEQIAGLDPKDPDFQRQVDVFIQENMKIAPVYGGQQVHSLKITPQMKEDVLGKGQPLYQIKRKADSPPFVSQLRNVVADDKMFPPSLKSPSVINTLMKYGVKVAEIQDTGLAKFLADKARVTREQMLDYIDMNMVTVEEVVRTDDAMDQVEELSFTEPEPDEETGEYPEDPEWFAQGMNSFYTITRGAGGRFPFRIEIFSHDDAYGTPIDKATGRTVEELIGWANSKEREFAGRVGNVKFEDYTLPGAAKNYRELLITLPLPTKTAQHLVGEITVPDTSKAFTDTHWDEPNVLAHIRFDERTDAAGKPTLFIEEVQSDWHSEGRRKGYRGVAPDPQILRDAFSKAAAAISRNDNLGHDTVKEAFDGIQLTPEWRTAWSWDSEADIDAVQGWLHAREGSYKQTHGVPDAPFKDTWYELTLKRAIRWASEHG
ncbi:MAG: hypothetical protein HW377_2081, partial [Actinobacteria bacterium]|nr:hypothetical protein [Actinomycetota bacterium]